MNKATLESAIRNDILAIVRKAIETELNTDALTVSASEIALPVVDAEGNEKFAIVKVSIPRGTRNGNKGRQESGQRSQESAGHRLERAQGRTEKSQESHPEFGKGGRECGITALFLFRC